MLHNTQEFQFTGLKWEEAEAEMGKRGILIEGVMELRPPFLAEGLGDPRLVLIKPGKRGIIAIVTYENYCSKERQPRSMAGFRFLIQNE